ncbi:DUF4255 domain-containing protein [Rubrivivax albus]|uniref:DUF4255 domain-containing protein n=1 Tax=Rubrivivax albus TaxID=2499835 RepID=A0A3S2TJM9_9BURK|nr:DUF4255 domain-containing protein [Rubrivivax albus]
MPARRARHRTRQVIDTALQFLADEANAHLLRRTGSELGAVTPGTVVDDAGRWTGPMDTTRLLMFQVEEERALRSQLPERTLVGGREVSLPPPLRLNLVLLFAGRFQQYGTAMRTLSHLMAFFQARPVFSAAESPDLPPGVERLTMELLSWGPEQVSQMWSAIGARQLPSVLYRLRMVVLQDSEPQGTGLPITVIQASVGGR